MSAPELDMIEADILAEMDQEEFFSHKESIIRDLKALAQARAERNSALQQRNDEARLLLGESRKIAAYKAALTFAEAAVVDATSPAGDMDKDAWDRILHIIREALHHGTFDEKPYRG